MFEPYLSQWQLQADGAPIITLGSRLLPVRYQGMPAMLKIALNDEEKFGNRLMVWWNGDGAARVYAHCRRSDPIHAASEVGIGTGGPGP